MKQTKPGYKLLLILTLLFTFAAISTLIPLPSATNVSMLGYKAHCSFAPVSTIILLICAAITCKIRKKKFVVV